MITVIKELIIDARVTEPVTKAGTNVTHEINEDELIQKIVQQVMTQLHDEMRGMR
ncbi:hypothetical protein ID852_03605 [Xenorhabdus sp. 42]|uniref:DUF5908 family protein n=1 Tax=Xenorhabdus szentirmaii TaxID=290112 RepID=UPI001996CE0B|nr:MULTISPECIES: DUF5908 family protein [unclassified Xenorhabdus]MBD2794007.1 hypothetical protein [Xenorhabdus sp. CUL]MBD2803835.1 hypothetical protein [Xenorhabdus sp. ZM]MBD2819791.1 hypothetical protein [Xenorhabdus sp. 42]MBD2826597.1 hypothetical protein [Xenorhabdus sp. 5]